MATNYSYFEQSAAGSDFRIIKTHVSNLRSETIKKPISSTSYYGINGGVFNSPNGYSAPPTQGLAISWNKDDTSSTTTTSNANGGKSRGTLFTYFESGMTKAGITRCTNITDLKSKVGNIDFRCIVGGGDFALNIASDSTWNSSIFEAEAWSTQADYPFVPDPRRAGIGIKVENGNWYSYLAISKSNAKLYDLRQLFKDLGCFNAIHLDGSGSSQMQVFANGGLITDRGSDPDRYIWNMVRLKATT